MYCWLVGGISTKSGFFIFGLYLALKAPNIIVQKDAQKQALSGEPVIFGLVPFKKFFFGILGARFAPPGGPKSEGPKLDLQDRVA